MESINSWEGCDFCGSDETLVCCGDYWLCHYCLEIMHVENLYGENTHHIVESCYKGLAQATRKAIEIDPRVPEVVPSTKGRIGDSA